MDWTEWILVAVNVALVLFVFLQVKHTYRPIITIRILAREKALNDAPGVLETGELYALIGNMSPNLASHVRIKYEFFRNESMLLKIRKNLSYLNPNETTREPLDRGDIIKDNPELFEEHHKGNEGKKIPRETLDLTLKIQVNYRFGILPYKTRDSYKIEWGSLKSYPNFADHPILNCWNVRDGQYIHKLH